MDGRPWDLLAGKPYCPDCQEAIILGIAEPFHARTEACCCVVCRHKGTVRYLTHPLQMTTPVEMDLCPEHLRGLLSRSLGPNAYHQLRRQLRQLGLEAGQVFLLHDEFYDPTGRALHPAALPE